MGRLIKDANDLKELADTVMIGLMDVEDLDPNAALTVLALCVGKLVQQAPTPLQREWLIASLTETIRRVAENSEHTVTFVRPEKAR